MYQYLFDANVIVDFYTKQNRRASMVLDHIVEQRVLYREAALFIPTFCITEVFNVLAKLYFEQKKLSGAKYGSILHSSENTSIGRAFFIHTN